MQIVGFLLKRLISLKTDGLFGLDLYHVKFLYLAHSKQRRHDQLHHCAGCSVSLIVAAENVLLCNVLDALITISLV